MYIYERAARWRGWIGARAACAPLVREQMLGRGDGSQFLPRKIHLTGAKLCFFLRAKSTTIGSHAGHACQLQELGLAQDSERFII